jgi:hypothetical protein
MWPNNQKLLLDGGMEYAALEDEGIRPRRLRRFVVMSVTTTWKPMAFTDYDVLKGMAVFSADGQNVGSIADILRPAMEMPAARGQHFFLLDPGLIKDWFQGFDKVYLPESVIADVGRDRVTLSVTAEQIKQRGKEWTKQPAGFERYQRV